MEQVVLVRFGEIMLKGLNRHTFVERLAANIRRALSPLGRMRVVITQGRIFIVPREAGYDVRAAAEKVCSVFGVVSASVAYKTGKARGDIAEAAAAAARGYMEVNRPAAPGGLYAFKVETKRADKTYGRISPVVSRDTGEDLFLSTPGLTVDVNRPQFIVNVEIREDFAYVYTEKIAGFGGLPLGSNGKALLLLSGGIDSPVAGFMMAKRGVTIEALHFYSYPYTNERSKDKVIKLCEILAGYCGTIALHIIPFTGVQEALRDNCAEEYLTIVMRRTMMYIANAVAAETSSQALVTGESMGQVASQTMQGLCVTDHAAEYPVFRPLIGLDKTEVIGYAVKIGTYETSILPYDDCCSLFSPKHPKTKPKLEDALYQESRISSLPELLRAAAAGRECVMVGPAAYI